MDGEQGAMQRARTLRARLIPLGVLTLLAAIPLGLLYRQMRQERLNHDLIAAIKRNDDRTAIALLDQGADPNARDASLLNPPPFWQVFLDRMRGHGANLSTGKPVLLVAMDLRAPDISDKAGFFFPGPHILTNLTVVKALLDKGAEIHATYEYGDDPVSLAISNGEEDVALLLLERGADVRYRDRKGATALITAIHYGSAAITKSVLDKGADPNEFAPSSWGEWGEYHSGKGLVWKCDSNGCPILIHTIRGAYTSLDGCIEYVKALADGGADINARDSEGRTALMWAVFTRHDATVRLLLKRGADVRIRDNNGETALSVARKVRADGGVDMTGILKKAGAKE